MEEQLLTVEQVAKLLSIKPQTLRDAAFRGEIPCIQLWKGKRKTLLRFRKSDLDEFIRRRTSSPPVKN
jgi:excisionase family DNA binding protein